MKDEIFQELWNEVKNDEEFKQKAIEKFKERFLNAIENVDIESEFQQEIPGLVEHFNEVIMDNVDMDEVNEKIRKKLVNALEK